MPKESWAGDQEQESYKAWLKAGERGTRADCSHELVMAPSLLPQCLNPFSFVEWSNLYILSLSSLTLLMLLKLWRERRRLFLLFSDLG